MHEVVWSRGLSRVMQHAGFDGTVVVHQRVDVGRDGLAFAEQEEAEEMCLCWLLLLVVSHSLERAAAPTRRFARRSRTRRRRISPGTPRSQEDEGGVLSIGVG